MSLFKLGLFGGMTGIGILYALIFHKISMSLFSSLLAQSIILGLGFGMLNFLFANWYFYKYTELKNHSEMLKSKLFIDNLTGLYNRRAFNLELEKLDVPIYSVIFIDIDNFRVFNNQYGHKIGDTVLRKVSETVKRTVRTEDRAYRYGGEEIVVLLKNCPKKIAKEIGENIRTRVSELNNNLYPQITISIGVASCPRDGKSVLDVIEKSDAALLLAKNSGKNRTVCF
ncbi:MAG: GGDEF domain-containing protein [Desulfosporosinus sp.]|nr:GGDEF domain-containing protein [Desulfosporosinus sp.]